MQPSLTDQQELNTIKSIKHPTWATKFRAPGKELRLINGKYYLYEYTTLYDPVKKRSRKVSGKLLGSITQQEGFVESSKNLLRKQCLQLNEQPEQASTNQPTQTAPLTTANEPSQHNMQVGATKEFGFSQYILDHCLHFSQQLQKVFGHAWQHMMLLVYCRLLCQAPIKNMAHLMEQSWLAHQWQVPSLNAKKVSDLLKEIGKNREKTVEYMQAFMGKEGYFLADTSYIPSKSSNIALAKKGYSTSGQYDPQVHILYLYGVSSRMPAFYRLGAGNIREVKAFKLTMLESGVKDGIIIGDKGFYSEANIQMLTQEGLSYIIPLKRNSALLDYTKLKSNNFKDGSNYFKHEKRHVWYIEKELEPEKGDKNREEAKDNNKEEGKDKKKIVMFLDESLRLSEEEDYLTRIQTHPEEYTQAGYLQKKDSFGTMSLLTNLEGKSGQEIYQAYKSRMAIETMFDSMKNVLEADKTYMQNEEALQGWMFINHVALQCYQQLYLSLQGQGLTSQYSVKDFVMLLKDVRKVKINGAWHQAEVPTALEKLLKKFNNKHT